MISQEIPPYSKQPGLEDFYLKMRSRRSIREFSDLPVDEQILINAIRTAGTAPSGANAQPWFFALVQSQLIKERIREEAEKVEGIFYESKATSQWRKDLAHLGTNSEKPYLSGAPALIVVFTRHSWTGISEQKTYYPVESAGIAVGMLLTTLHLAGIATLTHTPKPMQFLNDILGLDRTHRPFMIVVAGHPKIPVIVPKIDRKPLDEIFKKY